MKKLIYFLTITTFGLGVTSCGDGFLDVTPKNSLSDNTFWQTEQDAELALAGLYENWETWSNIIYFDGMSDNAYYPGWSHKIDGSASPTNLAESYWGDPYSGDWFEYGRIRKYNNFLEKIENVSMDEATKERYKAEARFLRAYNYFYKVMMFGDMPLVTETLGPDAVMARTPAEEVKSFILQELDEISDKLPVQNMVQSEGHITSGAARALKARLELYMGNYATAMEDAQAVIEMGVYELYPDYRQLFLSESDNEEAILSIKFTQDIYPSRHPQFMLPGMGGGYANVSGTYDMVEAYETMNGLPISEDPTYDPDNPFENRDPRLEKSLLYPGQEWDGRYYNPLDQQIPNEEGDMVSNPDYYENSVGSPAGLIIKKYVEPMPEAVMQNSGQDLMVIRLPEMYLTYAEAAFETGQNMAQGLEYLNRVRKRAGLPEATALTEALVRRERRVEFAFENLRYFDIVRWDLGEESIDGTVYGVRKGSVNNETGEVTWESEHIILEERNFVAERNYLLPIPQREMDNNPEMTQNPGY
ncbi:Starch-binding associating with outer membrane [Fodinibius roseus]|uniref:Starch-binding associating with outer membrane n=1 Tax=Fodinibius roseus TaxID=1194090 RepID=A0A1M4V6A4_9BACT|nr:RagB/SusD family nutrient uptake outer membrane protein [Fodinibius roseus]SHE64504.1 Starch-binding associating with outer membrane [Fodinibius roseus]